MMGFFEIMYLPFIACLILTVMHAYLGLHIIERQVIFVDLALAQIAVLGASLALIFGYEIDSMQGYYFSLVFTVAGAGIFAFTRFRKQKVPQEAIIGVVYVVAAALLLIILSFSGEGTEHIHHFLAGDILLITQEELMRIFFIYLFIGFIHIIFRKQFYLISRNSEGAFMQKLNVRAWDFLFYITFGFVITSSVKVAGVLVVFSFLVIPAICAMILSDNLKIRPMLGWGIGTAGSIIGMAVSYFFDLPTGASVVCILGFILVLVWIGKAVCCR